MRIGHGARNVDGHHVRPEIQALRALAVVLVVIYHMDLRLLPGGFIGVDVFFVISGFLITAHIAKGLEGADGFRLSGFYMRRVRRLLPAALTVLAVVGVVTLVRLPATTWNETGPPIIASVFYVQNWYLAAHSTDYLAAATYSPVEHFWSLSVEEQFYLFWPVSLMFAAWIGRRLGRTHLRACVRYCNHHGSVICVVGVANLHGAQAWRTSRRRRGCGNSALVACSL